MLGKMGGDQGEYDGMRCVCEQEGGGWERGKEAGGEKAVKFGETKW